MKFYRLAIISFLLCLFSFPLKAQYDKDVFFFRGRQALADGKFAQSIEQFNILARLDTTEHLTFFYRGIAKYNLGDLRGAQKDFSTSVRLNPVFTSGWHYKAITESRFGEYDRALEDLERAISLRPGYEGLYFSRGVTYFLAQQFDKAVSDFDRYIRRQPKDPSAYLNRGASRLFLGDTTKAMTDYNKAIALDRFESEGYIRRGRLYAAQNRLDEAIADMDKAISLDSTSTFAYFNRALMHYDRKDFNAAMGDLNTVLRHEPGNALTLYNRSLISAQVGNFEDALDDMDRVININPRNVLAYFNRASYFVELERWQDALEDYDKAIGLYPDFAKAYLNRSYVENMLGMKAASRMDYNTAQEKIRDYRRKNADGAASFADTTRKYSSLLALDAEFAKNDFDDELLQHRDIDIRLRPLYKFSLCENADNTAYALHTGYENALLGKFLAASPVPMALNNSDTMRIHNMMKAEQLIYGRGILGAGVSEHEKAYGEFLKALYEIGDRQFNSAMAHYGNAIEDDSALGRVESLWKAYYLMNRGVLRADMIEFISSIESNVTTLTMDDKGATRARVKDQVSRDYDYGEAIEDMEEAREILPDLPHLHFNLGNLYCLSSKLVEAIGSYGEAVKLYPFFGDAYYNRGLVLIYLKDKEKGCIDLSRAGELGVADAYGVIKKYCTVEEHR